ncbi:MAG: SNF2-related protein, partial [Thermoplasmata archaeon]
MELIQSLDAIKKTLQNPAKYENYLLFLRSLEYNISKDLISIEKIKVRLYPHQIDTAYKVINFLQNKALLADEVGLGKTIEAGIVLKELILRGVAENILILTPASLTLQWQAELQYKFDEEFKIVKDLEDWNNPKLISSIDLAKRPEHKIYSLKKSWDLVIVDEAHKLKNPETQNYKLVDSLSKKNILFLTATPLENSLLELYNITNLIRPGLFGTMKRFKDNFIEKDERSLKNVNELKKYLETVMIRNKRSDTIINLPDRKTENIFIDQTDKEHELYADVTQYVINGYWNNYESFKLINLQRAVTSSSYAIKKSLWNYIDKSNDINERRTLLSLYSKASSISENSKGKILNDALEKVNSKVLIFTAFLSTQDYLYDLLSQKGLKVIKFHGTLNNIEKKQALESFEKYGDVLISTDAGNEGLNLQFCNIIVNYDLPWNPMILEQRIGRIHRIGQTREVLVINMVLNKSIEEYIFEILTKKIKVFETVVGDIDLILSNIQSSRSFEERILEILASSKDVSMLTKNFRDFEKEIENGRELYEKIKSFNEDVFKNFDLS